MGKDPAFLFYPADAAEDVSHMNRLERGCYFDLIQAQKKFGGFTTEQARKILGKDFDECWNSIQLILESENEIWFIPWVKESIQKRKDHAEKQRKRIQDYWDSEKNNSTEIPRNNNGTTVDVPLGNGNENGDINLNKSSLKEEIKDPLWVTSFDEFIRISEPVWDELMNDWEFISILKEQNPKTLIKPSIQKSWETYWGEETEKSGWKKKVETYKAAKKKAIKEKVENFNYEINWRLTIQKTIGISRVPVIGNMIDTEAEIIQRMNMRKQ